MSAIMDLLARRRDARQSAQATEADRKRAARKELFDLLDRDAEGGLKKAEADRLIALQAELAIEDATIERYAELAADKMRYEKLAGELPGREKACDQAHVDWLAITKEIEETTAALKAKLETFEEGQRKLSGERTKAWDAAKQWLPDVTKEMAAIRKSPETEIDEAQDVTEANDEI